MDRGTRMHKTVKTEDCGCCGGGEEPECEVVKTAEAVEATEAAEVVEAAEAAEAIKAAEAVETGEYE